MILRKIEGFFAKIPEEVGPRVDFYKVRELFYKMFGKCEIQAVRPADPTAGKRGRRGHASNGPGGTPFRVLEITSPVLYEL